MSASNSLKEPIFIVLQKCGNTHIHTKYDYNKPSTLPTWARAM